MTADRVLERLREYLVGPARFMNLLSCFELGVVDVLRRHPGMSAGAIARAVGAAPEAIEQLMHLSVKEGFVSCDTDSGTYTLAGLGTVADEDLRRVLAIMNMVKTVMLRQGYYLTESVRTGAPVGLRRFYGHEGNLYEALAEHEDLRTSWGVMMDTVTAHIDPWFFGRIEIPAGSKVLDVAGNTGLGAILACQLNRSAGIRVTTFDLPEKEDACLRNFAAAGVGDHCSFVGGDALEAVPDGFDVILVKHFLDMFDRGNALRIIRNIYAALKPGGRVNVLGPVYPEDLRDSYGIDFFPTYFLGCTMGQGGPQKLSTYREWFEECGFTVTSTDIERMADMTADALVAHGILSATKADQRR